MPQKSTPNTIAVALSNLMTATCRHTHATREWVLANLSAVAFFALFAVILLVVTPEDTIFNAAYRLALRMTQGHLSLAENYPWMELYLREGKAYPAYPPITALVLVPAVILSGGQLTQPAINSMLIWGSAVLLFALFRGIPRLAPFAWLAAVAYGLGTQVFYCATQGTVWLLMHAEGNFFTLGALYFILVRRNPLVAGLFYGIAAGCRPGLWLAAPAILLLLAPVNSWTLSRAGKKKACLELARDALGLGLGAAAPVALILGLNFAVTGNPLKLPYAGIFEQWQIPATFHPRFFLSNLRFYLIEPPRLLSHYPFFRFNIWGHAVWYFSPFLLGIFFSSWRDRLPRTLLLATVSVVTLYLFYYANGFAQFGSRYSQDLYPFLFPIAFLAFENHPRGRRWFLHTTVAVAVCLNLYATFVANHFPFDS